MADVHIQLNHQIESMGIDDTPRFAGKNEMQELSSAEKKEMH
jgi:hypothetical protein